MDLLPKLLNKEHIKEFLNSFDNVLTDCDGVLWSGDILLGKANEALNLLRSLGKKIFYVTNNSTKSRAEYVKKCQTMGFIADKEEIVSTSYVTALYLKQQQFKKKVYIIGASGIATELDEVGIDHSEVGPEPQTCDPFKMEEVIDLDANVGAVVVGFDPHISYPKIVRAASHLKDNDCLFIATNTDENFPGLQRKIVLPGAGCMVRCVMTTTGRCPEVIGKPSEKMFSLIQEKHNLDPSRTLMIGDRCNTDILFGKNCGLHTLAVLSGVTKIEDFTSYAQSSDEEQQKLLPEYYLEKLDSIIELLKDN